MQAGSGCHSADGMYAIQAMEIKMIFLQRSISENRSLLKKLIHDQNHKKAQTYRRGGKKAKNHPRNHFDFGGGLPTTS
jgi:hypothetical protein